MKLTNAYIIDGDVIEKQIEMLKGIIAGTEHPCDSVLEKASLNTLLSIKQHLKPALPIVEKAWNERCKQDFLTKEFI